MRARFRAAGALLVVLATGAAACRPTSDPTLAALPPETRMLVEAALDAPALKEQRDAARALSGRAERAEAVVDALLAALVSGPPARRARAAAALGILGPQAARAVPALVSALDDGEADVRAAAAVALGRLGPPARAAVPALMKAVADPSWVVRMNAIAALGDMGASAAEAVPALEAAERDPHPAVRSFATQALRRIGLAPGGGGHPPVASDRLVHLREHLGAHPAAGAEDAYKLLHQSVFGPGHLIPDRGTAAHHLAQEWEGLGETLPGEPLLEPLSDDPPLVRVNLRPYRDAGGSPGALVDALTASAAGVAGDPALLAACLEGAVDVLREKRGEAAAEELRRLALRTAGEGYPAVHHSEGYRQAYRPAYRVLLRGLVPAERVRPPRRTSGR